MLVNRGQVGRAVLTGELPLVVQLAAALSPEVLKAGPADAARPRPPGVADVQTRFISSVSPQRPCQDADLLRVNVGVCLIRRYPDTFGSAISTHMSSSRPERTARCLAPSPRACGSF